ncbi:MAG: hypothetical protein AAB300_04065 [Nitrospirota bacterium]
MQIEVTVLIQGKAVFPNTAVCRVEVQDVTYLDAPSKTLSSYEGTVIGIVEKKVLTTMIEVLDQEMINLSLNVWAHLSMTGVPQINHGDYLTTVAYPLTQGVGMHKMVVELSRI